MLKVIPSEDFMEEAHTHWKKIALANIQARGRFEVALSGGSTPARLYQRLAADGSLKNEWSRMRLWFGDERCVPPTDEQSNYRMSQTAGLTPELGLAIERMEGELDPLLAAEHYSERLQQLPQHQGWPCLDLVMLGMGEDGHVASLFPGSANLAERQKWVTAAHIDDQKGFRISLTMPVIAAARQILVLVTGAAKAEVLAEVLNKHDPAFPASEIARLPQSIWLVDEPAARLLKSGHPD
jgi:6-phosphogluconolactonase